LDAVSERIVILLEEIAWNTQGGRGRYDKSEYIRSLYASGQQGATAIHGDLRAQPCACEGQMPGHEQGGDAQIQQHINQKPTIEEKDDRWVKRYKGGKK
jgi:hypothetical protein